MATILNTSDLTRAREAFENDRVIEVIGILAGKQFPSTALTACAFMLADSYRRIGLFSSAKNVLESIAPLSCSTDFFDSHVCLAEIHKSMGDFISAEQSYSNAINCCGVRPPGWLLVLMGVNLLCLQEFERAREMFVKSLNLTDVDRDEALLNLSFCERALGSYGEAFRLAQLVSSMGGDLVREAELILNSLIGFEKV